MKTQTVIIVLSSAFISELRALQSNKIPKKRDNLFGSYIQLFLDFFLILQRTLAGLKKR